MGEQKLLSPVFVLKDMSFLQVHLISLVNVSPGVFFFLSRLSKPIYLSPPASSSLSPIQCNIDEEHCGLYWHMYTQTHARTQELI